MTDTSPSPAPPSASPVRTLFGSDAVVGRWTLDPARSAVRFAHRTMWGLVKVRGRFGEVAGEGTVSPEHQLRGEIRVAAASLDTGNAKRDQHVRGADFLDAGTHPSLVVTVRSAAPHGEDLQLESELSVRGVRAPLTLTASLTELTATTLAAHVHGVVDRRHHGLTWNTAGMLKHLTTLDIDAVFTRG